MNREYVSSRRSENYTSNGKKQSVLFETERLHKEVLKKVFRKDLEETMCFNIKVVLPSVTSNSSVLMSNREGSNDVVSGHVNPC